MSVRLKYGDSSTYRYQLNNVQMEALTKYSMRSEGQTLFLYNLLEGDYNLLFALEVQIKICGVSYCPSSREEVYEILNR